MHCVFFFVVMPTIVGRDQLVELEIHFVIRNMLKNMLKLISHAALLINHSYNYHSQPHNINILLRVLILL